MAEIDLMDSYPKTVRNVAERAKASAEDRILSKRFGKEYFDGTRLQGCGGYSYDGRWKPVVKRIQEYYNLDSQSRILDVGCAKGFMLHDFLDLIPGVTVAGLDISDYTLTNAMESVKPFLTLGNCKELPYPDDSFDLVISIATIDAPEQDEVEMALRELERVSCKDKFIKVGAYRTEAEKARLDDWNIVANTFMYCHEWEALFKEVGYTGDYSWFLP